MKKLVVILMTLLFCAGGTASASPDMERQFLDLMNQERATPVVINSSLSAQAREWSQKMASDGTISHSVGRYVENVGAGASVTSIHYGFTMSPSHYAAMIDERYREVGIGVVQTDAGAIFVTVRFLVPEVTQPEPEPSETPEAKPTPTQTQDAVEPDPEPVHTEEPETQVVRQPPEPVQPPTITIEWLAEYDWTEYHCPTTANTFCFK